MRSKVLVLSSIAVLTFTLMATLSKGDTQLQCFTPLIIGRKGGPGECKCVEKEKKGTCETNTCNQSGFTSILQQGACSDTPLGGNCTTEVKQYGMVFQFSECDDVLLPDEGCWSLSCNCSWQVDTNVPQQGPFNGTEASGQYQCNTA
jgi:hypothetical protein